MHSLNHSVKVPARLGGQVEVLLLEQPCLLQNVGCVLPTNAAMGARPVPAPDWPEGAGLSVWCLCWSLVHPKDALPVGTLTGVLQLALKSSLGAFQEVDELLLGWPCCRSCRLPLLLRLNLHISSNTRSKGSTWMMRWRSRYTPPISESMSEHHLSLLFLFSSDNGCTGRLVLYSSLGRRHTWRNRRSTVLWCCPFTSSGHSTQKLLSDDCPIRRTT